MPLMRKTVSRLGRMGACAGLAIALLASGCAVQTVEQVSLLHAGTGAGSADQPFLDRMRVADTVLIGELHDHPEQHRIRLGWLRALGNEVPITLVMEHFDVEAQERINAARASQSGDRPLAERARELAQAADFRFDGWDWTLIGPVVEFALDKNLPLLAANLSSREAYAIARGQSHPMDRPAPEGWTPRQDAVLAEMIREGHCNALPEPMIAPMMRAQRARDAQMAAVLEAARAAGRKPVLLAGNGHVRRDVGVPAYLTANTQVVSVALLELGSEVEVGAYDIVRFTPRLKRPDPCEGLRERFGKAAPK